MRSGSTSVVVLAVVLGATMWGGRLAAPLAPVNAAAQASSESSAARDSYQRSIDHFLFRATATDGPQRGEELYFYKCWFRPRQLTHNVTVKSRVHPTYKTKYHVWNLPAYEQSLMRRSDVNLWLPADAMDGWKPAPSGQPLSPPDVCVAPWNHA